MATSDLFPGFASHWIDTSIGKIFARSGGSGPPLLVMHGFPQTHVQWHKVAPELAKHFTLILPDLPGYGWSVAPDGGPPDHFPYSKSAMAAVMIEVMEALGHIRFAILAHDRGARVAYRMALEQAGRVERLCLLDIVPTMAMWAMIETKPSPRTAHWPFLARPFPLPEDEIKQDPRAFQDHKLSLWTKAGDLSAYDPRALQHYHDFFGDPTRIHALCEDYRAGASVDRLADERDKKAGKTITCPVYIVWGSTGIPSEGPGPVKVWQETFAPQASGEPVESGHYLTEENPQGVLKAVLPFLTRL